MASRSYLAQDGGAPPPRSHLRWIWNPHLLYHGCVISLSWTTMKGCPSHSRLTCSPSLSLEDGGGIPISSHLRCRNEPHLTCGGDRFPFSPKFGWDPLSRFKMEVYPSDSRLASSFHISSEDTRWQAPRISFEVDAGSPSRLRRGGLPSPLRTCGILLCHGGLDPSDSRYSI